VVEAVMLLSYSKLNTYRQCPLRYRFTYHDRLPRRPRQLFRAARRVHAALMTWLTYARDGAPSLAAVLQAYDRAWDAERHPEVRELREYLEGEEILREFHDANRERPCAPVFLEQKFEIYLAEHRLTGAIDRVDAGESGYEVIDYKLDRELRTQRAVDEDLQLGIYHLALREAHGIEPVALSLYFLRHNIKVTTSRPAADVQELKGWIAGMGDRITRDRQWSPCPGQWCAHCDFRSYCPAVTSEPLPVPSTRERLERPGQPLLPLLSPDVASDASQLSLEMGD
jgi:putative RecB family exonuclease